MKDFHHTIEEVVRLGFISPEILEEMSEEQLFQLNEDLHDLYSMPGVNKESVVNSFIFLKDECKERGLDLPEFDDDLEKEAGRLGEAVEVGQMVEFVTTYQAISLTGSSVYGMKEPHDFDWLIRSSDRIPEFENAIANMIPDHQHHFVYELKGPNWKFTPVADFLCSPKDLAEYDSETTLKLLGQNFKEMVNLGPHIFHSTKDGKKVVRVNSSLLDNGTLLKLQRIYQDPDLQVIFSKEPEEGENPVANLVMRAYKEFNIVDVGEPEFEPYYELKPVPALGG